MTCKDCIHGCMCGQKEDLVQIDDCNFNKFSKHKNVEQLCEAFKNKADFVEVVWCEKCKYRTEVTEDDYTFFFCRKRQNYIKLTDFCSYGERVTDTKVGSK